MEEAALLLSPHVLGQRRLQADWRAQARLPALPVRIAGPEPVQGELLEGPAALQLVQSEGADKEVALELEP